LTAPGNLPIPHGMGRTTALGVGLGAASFVAGVGAVALDAPLLGGAAGVVGAGVAGLLVRARTAAARSERAGGARVQQLETALVASWKRAADVEAALVAAESVEPELSAEEVEALVDPVTGLYGGRFFDITLASRVAAARRHLRPVAVVMVQVAAGVKEGKPEGADPLFVSQHVRTTLREADIACRIDGEIFGLVLEDTPENGAVWTVERVRRALHAERQDLTLWAGVACYPAHAFDADELQCRATAALDAAREWRQDRIEVATAVV
jgi:diguanylate cyclase (GGDEF)-like protein